MATWLWLVSLLGLLVLGFVFVEVHLRQMREESETEQWRMERLRQFAAQLTQGGLTGGGEGAEVLGIYQGRQVRLSFREEKGVVYACFVLTVAPRGLAELDVSKATWRTWLRRNILSPEAASPERLRVNDRLVLEAGEREHLEGLFLSGRMEEVLGELFGQRGFKRLTLRHNMLRVERPLAPADRLEGLAAVFHCLREVAWLCEGKEVSIQSLGDEPRLVWTAGTNVPLCPYCRSALMLTGEELEVCGECRTVHHQGCFSEAGGCTVFGCVGRGSPANRLGRVSE